MKLDPPIRKEVHASTKTLQTLLTFTKTPPFHNAASAPTPRHYLAPVRSLHPRPFCHPLPPPSHHMPTHLAIHSPHATSSPSLHSPASTPAEERSPLAPLLNSVQTLQGGTFHRPLLRAGLLDSFFFSHGSFFWRGSAGLLFLPFFFSQTSWMRLKCFIGIPASPLSPLPPSLAQSRIPFFSLSFFKGRLTSGDAGAGMFSFSFPPLSRPVP